MNEKILDTKTNWTKYGPILAILGEILIILQGIIYFSQFVLRGWQLNPMGLGFVVFLPLLPIPAFILFEFLNFIAEKKHIKILKGFSYIFLLFLASAFLLLGGGWFFGTAYMMVGVILRIVTIDEKVK